MKTISQTIGANASVRFVVPGRYFRLLSATGAVRVEFFSAGRSNDEPAVDVLAGFYAIPPTGFDELLITDTSGASNTVVFAFTRGSGGYDRSAGTVDVSGVVDTNPRNAPATDASLAFVRASVLTAAGGEYGQFQLWNPAASGRALYLDRVRLFTRGTNAPTWSVYRNTAALSGGTQFTSGAWNKRVNASVQGNVGLAASLSSATVQGTATLLYTFHSQTDEADPLYDDTPPFRLDEGLGLLFVCNTVNVATSAHFEWREAPL